MGGLFVDCEKANNLVYNYVQMKNLLQKEVSHKHFDAFVFFSPPNLLLGESSEQCTCREVSTTKTENFFVRVPELNLCSIAQVV